MAEPGARLERFSQRLSRDPFTAVEIDRPELAATDLHQLGWREVSFRLLRSVGLVGVALDRLPELVREHHEIADTIVDRALRRLDRAVVVEVDLGAHDLVEAESVDPAGLETVVAVLLDRLPAAPDRRCSSPATGARLGGGA